MNGFSELIVEAREHKASDLHLVAGMPPIVRVNGEILSMSKHEAMDADEVWSLIEPLLTDAQKETMEREGQLCFSTNHAEVGYTRISLYKRLSRVEAAIRLGIMNIPTFEELGLPPKVEDLARRPNGLILITGSTGAGKTTTFNAMLDLINRERRCKIITIEDPIEYVHRPIRSLIIQQEVGTDVRSFPAALLHALRQDPDVIGLGELREMETISAALLAAETGHLVLATLHTNDAANTVNRVVDVFPGHQQQQIRYQLSGTIQGIINQRLLPRVDRAGRVLACEIMTGTEAVRSLIRENKSHQLESVIATGAMHGMRSMKSCVQELYDKGVISFDTYTTLVPPRSPAPGKTGANPIRYLPKAETPPNAG